MRCERNTEYFLELVILFTQTGLRPFDYLQALWVKTIMVHAKKREEVFAKMFLVAQTIDVISKSTAPCAAGGNVPRYPHRNWF